MAPYCSAAGILVRAAHGAGVAGSGPWERCVTGGTAGLLCPAVCEHCSLQCYVQGDLQITGVMLKAGKAWPALEAGNGVGVRGVEGWWCQEEEGNAADPALAVAPASCGGKEELGRGCRRAELAPAQPLWRWSVTHTGTCRGLWAEPLELILPCSCLEAVPSSPVEKCQGWIKGAASECPQLGVGFPGRSLEALLSHRT